jgi:hypothetical protein
MNIWGARPGTGHSSKGCCAVYIQMRGIHLTVQYIWHRSNVIAVYIQQCTCLHSHVPTITHGPQPESQPGITYSQTRTLRPQCVTVSRNAYQFITTKDFRLLRHPQHHLRPLHRQPDGHVDVRRIELESAVLVDQHVQVRRNRALLS